MKKFAAIAILLVTLSLVMNVPVFASRGVASVGATSVESSAKSETAPKTNGKGGEVVPDFDLVDANGQHHDLKSLRGKIVVLNYWASWCPPCRREMSSVDDLAKRYENSDVVVLGISSEEAQTIRTFLHDNNYSLTTLVDTEFSVGQALGIEVVPTTIILDRDGRIMDRHEGAMDEDALADFVRQAKQAADGAALAKNQRR